MSRFLMLSKFLILIIALGFSNVLSKAEEVDIASLMALADRLEIPQTVKTGKLVKISAHSGDTDLYVLGFTDQEGKKALVGFQWWDLAKDREVQFVNDPKSLNLDGFFTTGIFDEVHGVNLAIVTGIQLLRMNYMELGRKLIDKGNLSRAGRTYSPIYISADLSVEEKLLKSALAAAMNEISTESPEFSKILQRVELVLAELPDFDPEAKQWLLEGLREASTYVPNVDTEEAKAVEEYLASGGKSGGLFGNDIYGNKRKVALARLGFKVIPELMKHRESVRMTNHLMVGFNNFPSYPMRAGEVVDVYLREFANQELGRNWLEVQQGVKVKEDVIDTWWAEAKAMGEEAYVARYLLAPRSGKDKPVVGDALLVLAGVRYPKLAIKVYKECLDSGAQSGSLAYMIADSSYLPSKEKSDLFASVIEKEDLEHRNSALRCLWKIDRSRAEDLLLELLKNAPSDTKTAYWRDDDASLNWFVSQSDRLDIWRETYRWIRRARLGMQMEVIHGLTPAKDAPPEVLGVFFAIYERFRNDRRVRDTSRSSKFDGPGAGFPHDRIAVRDFIHDHWATWLGLDIEQPEEGASDKVWSEFRKKVANQVVERVKIRVPVERR